MTEAELFSTVLYGAVGGTAALSLLIFAWGFITYIARLGTERRVEGIRIMEWSVGLIIATIVLIAILNFLIERYPHIYGI